MFTIIVVQLQKVKNKQIGLALLLLLQTTRVEPKIHKVLTSQYLIKVLKISNILNEKS